MYIASHELPTERPSLREAIMLAEVSEDRVKKDIERGYLEPIRVTTVSGPRLFVEWLDVFSIAAAYHSNALSSRARSKIYSHWHRSVTLVASSNIKLVRDEACDYWMSRIAHERIVLDKFLFVDMKTVFETVSPRVETYARGLSRIERVDGVVGGEAVFKGSRLPVMHVGGMYENGETIENILEDYPYLDNEDVHFARMFYLAHPPLGRPRAKYGTHDDKINISGPHPSRRDDVSGSRG